MSLVSNSIGCVVESNDDDFVLAAAVHYYLHVNDCLIGVDFDFDVSENFGVDVMPIDHEFGSVNSIDHEYGSVNSIVAIDFDSNWYVSNCCDCGLTIVLANLLEPLAVVGAIVADREHPNVR